MSQLEHTIHDMYTALVHEANVCLEAVIASSRVTAAHPHHPAPLAQPRHPSRAYYGNIYYL